MKSTLYFRYLKSLVIIILLWVLSVPVLAQTNLIYNGDFQILDFEFYNNISDYTRRTDPNDLNAGEFIHDVNSNGHGGGVGWPNNLYGYDGQGDYYLLFNGFGGNINQTKAAWRQTVSVTTNTTYTFSAQVRNLSQPHYLLGHLPAQMRLKINNEWADNEPNQLPQDYEWHEWTVTWPSGSSTQAVIEIIDVCNGNSGFGDDFGIDHISFAPNEIYQVNAQNDTASVCLNHSVQIPVVNNDGVLPSGSNTQVSLEILTPVAQINGTTTLPTINPVTKYINFNYNDASYTGNAADFQYRVTWHGLTSEAWVHVNLARPPTISGIELTSPITVCVGESLQLPTPVVDTNGSEIELQGWQVMVDGNWQDLPENNTISSITNGHTSIRYYAENYCTPPISYSDEIQLNVIDKPVVLESISPLIPSSVCAPYSFSITPPAVNPNGSDLIAEECGWQMQVGGQWVNVPNTIEYQTNGTNVYNIRYYAVNDCNANASDTVTLTVFPAFDIYDTIIACHSYLWYDNLYEETGDYSVPTTTEDGCDITAHLSFTFNEDYNTHPVTLEPVCDSYTWAQNGITYYASGTYTDTVTNPNPIECDDVYILNLTVNHPPVINEPLLSPNPIEVCTTDGALNVTVPDHVSNNGTSFWEYATSENGPWEVFTPTAFSLGYGSYWLRFGIGNSCDTVYSQSPVPFYVSDAPVISLVSGELPTSVCKGQLIELPEVEVDWMNMSQSGIVARWEISENGGNSYAVFEDLTMPIERDCWIRYFAQNATCASTILGPAHVLVTEVEDEVVNYNPECDSVLFGGQYYYESADIEETVDEPCPHSRIYHLEVNHSDRPETNPLLIEEKAVCEDMFVWHGRTYYRSEELQIDQWDTVNMHGCDSVRELRLRFGDANEIWDNGQYGCDAYTWLIDGVPHQTYYYEMGQSHVLDTFLIPGEGGVCDTYYYLDLTLGKTWEAWESPTDSIPICRGDEYNGVVYTQSVMVYDTLTAITGCDSIVSRYLSVIQPRETTDTIINCNVPYIWYSQGQTHWFEFDGEEFMATLTSNETGCDSIVTLHFMLSDQFETHRDTLVCEPFVWFGHPFNEDGQWSHTYTTVEGCDSIVNLNVSFIQTEVLQDSLSVCDGYEFNGTVYDQPGFYQIYHDTVFTANGCVQFVQLLDLIVNGTSQTGVISGQTETFVATNIMTGIYWYRLDRMGSEGDVVWSVSNPLWQILESDNDSCCLFVGSPGSVVLEARFMSSCGWVVCSFPINAVFYGIDELESSVSVYPNPTKGIVTIEAIGIESIRLIDMLGQTLDWRECGHSDSVVLNLSGYAPSVYLLEIKTINGLVKRRVTF